MGTLKKVVGVRKFYIKIILLRCINVDFIRFFKSLNISSLTIILLKAQFNF